MLAPPIAHLSEIDLREANGLLDAWKHRMGPVNRPFAQEIVAHALFQHGSPVGILVTAPLISASSAGFGRSEALELARVCAIAPDICRPLLRLWRLFLWPELSRSRGVSVAISYQDEALHSGNLYRFDGWVEVGRSRSGSDKRSGRRGRNKRIWAWPPESAIR